MVTNNMDVVINAEITEVPAGHTPITTYGNFYHNILACLDYPKDAPPVADLLRSYYRLDGDWLIASPIHWQATHNDAMITALGSELQLSEIQSRAWFAALAEFVASDISNLYYHDPHTWLLQCDGKPQLTAKPVHTLHHQSMMPELKRLDKTLFWQRFITENQMFFSTHPLNKARTEVYPINGLWLWGNGKLQACGQKQLICSDESLWQLARVLSTNVSEYQSVPSIADNSVLLFSELGQHELCALQTRLQKNKVRWYWNNVAYLTKPRNWWSRFRAPFIERF